MPSGKHPVKTRNHPFTPAGRTMLAFECRWMCRRGMEMFDTCFDSPHSEIPRNGRRLLWAVRIAAAAMTMMAGWAGAQLPGAPVLQNAWASPGMAGALNLGSGGGSLYALAGSWTPASGRMQLSGGIGSQSRTGDESARWVYGVRLAVPLANPNAGFGFGAFAGIGGSNSSRTSDTLTADSTSGSATRIPLGVALGWRRALGSRGFSLYTTPSYLLMSGGGKSTGLMRVGLGADVGVTSSIGVTAGLEFGQTKSGSAGPAGTVYGLGVSYAFGKR